MREIKFRIWVRSTKKLIEWRSILFRWKLSEIFGGSEDFVMMQYTGLKDKNGKEIYEGDIVKYQIWQEFHNYVTDGESVVDWNEKQGGWNPMCRHTVVDDGFYNWEIENIEIIGNIYENPELLTQSKKHD